VVQRGAARDRVAVAAPGPKEFAGEARRRANDRCGACGSAKVFFAWAGRLADEAALPRNICRSAGALRRARVRKRERELGSLAGRGWATRALRPADERSGPTQILRGEQRKPCEYI